MRTETFVLTIFYAGLSYVGLELIAKLYFKALPAVALAWGCLAATALIVAGKTGAQTGIILACGGVIAAEMYIAVRRGGRSSAIEKGV